MSTKPPCYAYYSTEFVHKVSFEEQGYPCFVVGCTSSCKEVRTLTRHLQTQHDKNYHCKQNPQNELDDINLHSGSVQDLSNSENTTVLFPTTGIQVDKEPEELVAFLRDYGLGIVLRKALLCFSCNRLFLSSEAPSHWTKHHARASLLCSGQSATWMAENLTKMLHNCTTLTATRHDFYSSLPLDRSPFQHIPLQRGWKCIKCDYICLKQSSLEKSCKCPGKLRTNHRQVFCQEIWFTNTEGSPKCIEVNPANSGTVQNFSDPETLQLPWFSPDSTQSDDSLLPAQRDITTFLRRLGYVDRMKNTSTSVILSALKPLEDLSLAQELRSQCAEYLQISQKQIQMTEIKSSALLKSLESAKTGSFVKNTLRVLFKTSTIQRYSLCLARLLTFAIVLIREPELTHAISISMTQDQEMNISSFLKDISEHITEAPPSNKQFEPLGAEADWDSDSDSDSDSNSGSDLYADSALDSVDFKSIFQNEENQISTLLPQKLSSLHKCLISLYTHKNHEDIGAYHFLPSYIIFSSKRPDGKFKSAKKQTPALAALKYIGKVAFLHELFLQAKIIGKMYPSNEDWEKVSKWFTGNKTTPFVYLSNQQSQLTTFALKEPGLATITWIPGNEPTLMYEECTLQMRSFKDFCNALLKRLQDLLDLLLQGLPRDRFIKPLMAYRDNIQNHSPGYNFLSESEVPNTILYQHLLKDQKYFPQGGTVGNHKNISEYLDLSISFITHLSVVVYFTSGMPPRATELLATLICNDGRLRDLYVIGDEMVLQSAYLKTTNLTGRTGKTLRILIPEVSNVIVVHLTQVLPTLYLLCQNHYPNLLRSGTASSGKHPYFAYLFSTPEGILKPFMVYNAIRKETQNYFDFSVGISDWRHIMKAIGRKYIPKLYTVNSSLETQANHSLAVAQQHYALSTHSPAGVREEEAEQYFYISKYWHYLLGFRTRESLPCSPWYSVRGTQTPPKHALELLSKKKN